MFELTELICIEQGDPLLGVAKWSYGGNGQGFIKGQEVLLRGQIDTKCLLYARN